MLHKHNSIKFALASEARYINRYKNIKGPCYNIFMYKQYYILFVKFSISSSLNVIVNMP